MKKENDSINVRSIVWIYLYSFFKPICNSLSHIGIHFVMVNGLPHPNVGMNYILGTVHSPKDHYNRQILKTGSAKYHGNQIPRKSNSIHSQDNVDMILEDVNLNPLRRNSKTYSGRT